MKRTSQGFTLVELLITMTILAIVAFVAAPNLADLVARGKIDKETSSLLSSIAQSRSEAIARNLSVVLCASTSGDACTESEWDTGWIVFADNNGDRAVSSGEPIIAQVSTETNVSIRESSGDEFIVFNADGSLLEASTFRVCGADADTDDAYSIVISVTGRPRRSSGASSCP